MPVFPTVTNAITISTGTANVSYSQIVGSLATYQYKVKQIYLKASDLSQLGNSYTFLRQTPDGNAYTSPNAINVNPYQFQSAYYWDFTDGQGNQVIFDNNTMFQFQLNPNASLQLTFYVDYNAPANKIANAE